MVDGPGSNPPGLLDPLDYPAAARPCNLLANPWFRGILILTKAVEQALRCCSGVRAASPKRTVQALYKYRQ